MGMPLRLLVVEDSADDVELLVRELRRGGYEPVHERVDTAPAMQAALERQPWDLVVSDHSVLQFDSLAALNVLKASGRDTPFIIVSGTIGEERAGRLARWRSRKPTRGRRSISARAASSSRDPLRSFIPRRRSASFQVDHVTAACLLRHVYPCRPRRGLRRVPFHRCESGNSGPRA